MSANPNRCGFCGGLEYTVGLQPNGYGASKRFNVVSKCDCFWDFSKTKNMSMKEQYRISHPEIQTCPHETSQEEIKKVLQS